MKSFIIWLTAVIIGGVMGFGATFIVETNFYVCLTIGVILGSSAGFTINIHRETDPDISDEDKTEISQKAS